MGGIKRLYGHAAIFFCILFIAVLACISKVKNVVMVIMQKYANTLLCKNKDLSADRLSVDRERGERRSMREGEGEREEKARKRRGGWGRARDTGVS